VADRGGIDYQIPRNALALLLVAQGVVIAPHIVHVSWWVVPVAVMCAGWRVMVFLGRWDYPSRWIKGFLVLSGAAGVGITEGTLIGLEPAVALLIVAFALKLLEMSRKRDAVLVIYLGYFVIATEFMFSQSMPVTIYVSVAVAVVTAALIGLNQSTTQIQPMRTLKLAAVLVFQSVPLMVVLFVLFPRLEPLWAVPLPHTGRTGIADVVRPGDIARLSRSDDLAFRATFSDRVPPRHERYWRGMVYSVYREGAWLQGTPPRVDEQMIRWVGSPVASWEASFERQLSAVQYEIILEPTDRPWLFALDVALPETEHTGLVRDFRLLARRPVRTRFRYAASSWTRYRIDAQLPEWLRRRNLLLPDDENPRSRALARSLMAASSSHEQFVARLLNHFGEEAFYYTLRPGTLPRSNSVDAFMFESRRGFCSHFASSFAYIARVAGVPARLIGGYQGGESGSLGNYVAVRQYDAHAWVEVWLEGRGWVRVDPTGAVAPDRIERGLQAALGQSELLSDSPFSRLNLQSLAGVYELLLFFDSLEHQWNIWVVGYDAKVQANYLEKLLGEVNGVRLALAILAGALLALAVVAPVILLRRRRVPVSPVVRIYRDLCKAFSRVGITREASEVPSAYQSRIALRYPDLAAPAGMTIGLVNQLLYNSDTELTRSELSQLKRLVTQLKRRLWRHRTL
jgi:transglutaminase-like putative cysteine protease